MSDLRRKVLDPADISRLLNPGKTTSRKAASRASSAPSSRATSRANSRSGSRQQSRQNSEDEFSDDDMISIYSHDSHLDDIIALNGHATEVSWQDELASRIDDILDRKRSSYEGREVALAVYIRILLQNYAKEELYGRTRELTEAFLRSIKAGATEKETLLAVRALALTIITDPTEHIFDQSTHPLNKALVNHPSPAVKSLVIYTLAIGCFYVGSKTETQSFMSTLLDIVMTDGSTVGVDHDSEVIAAALSAWGFLLSSLENPEEEVSEAMEFLVDKLDDPSVDVQIAAGECIALAYEMAYESETGPNLETAYVERFQPYGREADLINKLQGLTTGSKRYLNKRSRRSQHSAFQDILRTVEDPCSLQDGIGAPRSLMKLRVRKDKLFEVDKWEKMIRVQNVKKILQGGFQIHLMENARFFNQLGLGIENDLGGGASWKEERSKKKGKKPRWGLVVGEDGSRGFEGFLSDES